jgi:nucleoside-diphosphate-sugar epimerase
MIDALSALRLKAPVLVLGGTSLIGRFLMPRLESMGIKTFALSRTGNGQGGWLRGNLSSPGLEALLPTATTVLSLSPIWHLPPALPVLKMRGMQRLVAFSSTSVFTKVASPDPYERELARRLAEGEAAVRAFCEANGVAWTILRPTLIYAEGQDQNVSRLAGLARRFGMLPLYGRGAGLRQPVHAEDLALAVLNAAASREAHNRAYDLAGGEILTYRQMVERIFDGLGRRPVILPLPEWLWRVAFAAARPLLPGTTVQMGARMSEDLTFNNGPAKRSFGWNPRLFRPNFKV